MLSVVDYCSVCDENRTSYVRYGVVHCVKGHVICRDTEGWSARVARAIEV